MLNRNNVNPGSFVYIHLKTDDLHLGTYLIGEIILNINEYEDQLLHQEQKFFQNKRNQILDVSLDFSIVWCFSKLKYYADGLMKWNQKMIYEEEKLNFLRKKLNVIYEPLRVFDSRRKKNPLEHRSHSTGKNGNNFYLFMLFLVNFIKIIL